MTYSIDVRHEDLPDVLRTKAKGRRYFYHRLNKIRLLGEPGSAEFCMSYHAACEDVNFATSRPDQFWFVYFVQCQTLGLIKIGTAKHLASRISSMQTDCPDEIRVIGLITDLRKRSVERRIQRRFAHLRVRGEWFRSDPDLLAFIETKARPPAWFEQLWGVRMLKALNTRKVMREIPRAP